MLQRILMILKHILLLSFMASCGRFSRTDDARSTLDKPLPRQNPDLQSAHSIAAQPSASPTQELSPPKLEDLEAFDFGSGFHEAPVKLSTSALKHPSVAFPLSGLSADVQAQVDHAVWNMHSFFTYDAERHLLTAVAKNGANSQPVIWALLAYSQVIFGSGSVERAFDYISKSFANEGALPQAAGENTKRA